MKLLSVMLIVLVLTAAGCGSGGSGGSTIFSQSNTSTPGVAPDAPTIGSAVAGSTQAIVDFAAPAFDGGKPIYVYTVTSNPGGITAAGSTSPITVTGLTNGTSYTFTVTATNAAGTSAPSAASNSVTPAATVPAAPTGVTATFGDSQAVVSFVAPDNGGSTITGYTVTSIPGGITATGTGSPITVTGLTNGVAYSFTVTATNAVGTSLASAPTSSVTPVKPKLMGGAMQGIPLVKPVNVSTLAGSGWGSVDGTGTGASFGQLFGMTTDGTNLYVTEINGTVRKTVIATGVTTTVAGTFNANGYADGTGAAAQFGTPAGITTDGTNLYVADRENLNIRKIVIATGVVTTLAGQDTKYPASTTTIDGIGTAARFGKPIGITTDGTNLYVADFGYSSVRKIVIATGEVTTLAGTPGTVGSTDGVGAAARFNGLGGITTDGTYLYVADTYNCTIRKVVIATGEVTTLAGSPLSSAVVDGIGSVARFKEPMGIITDGIYLYITDQGAGNVRRLQLSTKAVLFLAGAPADVLAGETLGFVNGTGASARFNHPRCVTTDGKALYISDGDNYRIRKMQ